MFEINTHPTVISLSSVQKPNPKIDSSRFARIHEEAMLALDGGDGIEVKLPPELVDRAGAGLSLEEVHARALVEGITVSKKPGALAKLAQIAARLRA